MKPDFQDTIVAVSTPPGAGGIAVLRVSGSRASDVVQACTRGQPLPPCRKASKRTWQHPDTLEVLDDVVVTLYAEGASYTGELTAEIACHGSVYVQRVVLQSCIDAGARLAQPGEFTQRAFLNGRLDLAQAEGVGDLIASETAAAHRLALAQMKGSLSSALSTLREQLIAFAALIELENDFGEEDVEFADRLKLSQSVQELQGEVRRLRETFSAGQAIREGVTAVIAGRPNAGKSTVLNALLAEDRAIVSDIPGTTRDTIEATLVIEGVKFTLVDTAGIREASDAIEQLGVARSLEAVSRASVLVYVWDAAMTQPAEVGEDLAQLRNPSVPLIAVANKMDLHPYDKSDNYSGFGVSPQEFTPVSARAGMNLGLLKQRLFEFGVGEVPPRGSAVVTQARHVESLSQAAQALDRVATGLSSGLSGDLIALDLRQALHHIGEITGEIGTDDLLASIFSSFCIGK